MPKRELEEADPEQQGLKLPCIDPEANGLPLEEADPEQQGLKLGWFRLRHPMVCELEEADPEQQGLKPVNTSASRQGSRWS